MLVLLTTVPGIEDLVISEIKERFGDRVINASVFGESNLTGKVMAQIHGVTSGELRRLSMVEHVVLVLDEGAVGRDLESLRKCIWSLNLDRLLDYYTPNTSLGIDADRSGDHEFRSPEAAAMLGERLTEFLNSVGLRPMFNLDNPDLVLRLVIDHDRCVLGLSITREPLRNRPYRVFNHPAAINPIIANAMVRILNPRPNTRVCDLMCGSGTIVIEGALSRRDLVFLCGDVDYGYIRGAMLNVREAGVDSRVDFVVMDATRPPIRGGSCSSVASNPPFGIRMEPMEGITRFYRSLFNALGHVLNGGSRLVLITVRKSLVRRLCAEYGFEILSERVVDQGGVWSSIFLIGRRG